MKRIIMIAVSPLLVGCMLFSAAKIAVSIASKRRADKLLPIIADTLEEIIPARTAGCLEERYDRSLPSISLEGEDFCGLLEVELYDVKLPVYSLWTKSSAKRPALYMGNPYDGSLIIGVRQEQFDFADSMDIGVTVKFTDLYGREFCYTVDSIKHSSSADTDILQSGSDQLTLFVKIDGQYLILRCVL